MKKMIAMLLVLVISLSACGIREKAAFPAEGSGRSKVVTDALGREVVLEVPASRLVGTHNPSINLAVALGGGGKYIAGCGSREMAELLYSYVFPEREKDVIQIGRGKLVNYEMVLTTGADLAILPERFAYMAEEFEAIGIPAIVILDSAESFDTIKNAINLMGEVVGEEERAEDILAYFDGIIAKISERTASVTEKPSVMFLGSSGMYSVAPGVMIQSDIMDAAGAVNAVTGVEILGEFADVSPEEMVGWNPDIVWVPAYASYTVEDVLNAPEFSSITAVQNGAVYSFPSELEPWDYPTVSACLGVAWAAYNLHPELYTYDELVADVNGLYDLLYSRTFTAEQIGIAK